MLTSTVKTEWMKTLNKVIVPSVCDLLHRSQMICRLNFILGQNSLTLTKFVNTYKYVLCKTILMRYTVKYTFMP